MDKEYNRKLDELALALAENAISAATKTVEEAENPVKNIKWITHGEFTVETGRTQIEEFISDSPIDVFYVFEAHTLIHRPGTTRFREKWLRDITDAKHVLMESITF
ncbi:A-kinase anchor protein 14-like [Choloepus didactylus]|uniref:A-kinase anchor protein 14-like n=1 Tax=Choloepus didactylus TaxID=27675 RepID=UPI00189EE5F7|nr:A-kinase anchor protein 14-like [Choloepus didactylus]